MDGIFGCLSTEWISKLSKSLQSQAWSESKIPNCQIPKHGDNASIVIEDHASLQCNHTTVVQHGSVRPLSWQAQLANTVGKHTKQT